MRIALVGGLYFDVQALDGFLFKLHEKYPGATIVTGQGRGAEKHAAESAQLLGFNVIVHEVTDQHEEWYGKEALLLQVADICYGADIILVVSSGGRSKYAVEWWHRINMHQRNDRRGLVKDKGDQFVSRREPENRIQLFEIAYASREQTKLAA